MKVLVLGSGPTGMLVGAALAERGHDVTSVDRDPGPSADGTWRRRGVMQFEHAHGFRPQVADVLQRRWAAAYDAWTGAGAEPMVVEVPGAGTRTIGNRSRRSVLERALRSTASDTPGLTLRTGHVDGLLADGGRVTGAVVDKVPLTADLVVDASGRSSRIDRTTDPELEGLCGLTYVDRTYQLLPGAEPGPMDNPLGSFNSYDGYQVLVFLHEAGHFSVLFVCPTADDALKPLRLDAVFDQACRAVPALAVWTDPDRARPTSPVMVGGALRNVYRSQRRLAGLVSVGDAVATTTPTRGRGVAMAFSQVDALLELMDDGADPGSLVHPFGAWCDEFVRPWVEDHIAIDTDAVARWQGAALDLTGPLTTERICEAAQADPRINEYAEPYWAMTALPTCLQPAEPLARAVYESGWRPSYAPGPSRDQLVTVIHGAASTADGGA
ncbi:FAD-dependent oxidoreductase [Nocardioides sp. URHA0032]|uniref:FAD-dependent oxidoreductase n=1 Tax=Nocardioides sp. URHA0032 TaxID=1380388 RepID=UPI0006879464|nr:NAD(P)-binding protein [Nocardioides sp. URHA0032]